MGTYQFSVVHGIKSASDETDSLLKIASAEHSEEKGSAIDNGVSPAFVSVDDPKGRKMFPSGSLRWKEKKKKRKEKKEKEDAAGPERIC